LQSLPDDFRDDLSGVLVRRLDLDDEAVALADEQVNAAADLDRVEPGERATLPLLRVGRRRPRDQKDDWRGHSDVMALHALPPGTFAHGDDTPASETSRGTGPAASRKTFPCFSRGLQ